MVQVYTRKSISNSLTNSERIIIENIGSVVNDSKGNKINVKLRKLVKNWDKLVYSFCILVNYLHYVSTFV